MATPPAPLLPKPVAVTFDCYGTLIDWEAGLERDLLFILRGKPDPPGLDAVVRAWGRHERALTSGKEGYRRYREVVAEALRLAFEEQGLPFEPADGHRLVRGMAAWQPFDDVPGALQDLRALGYQLAIFSNTDDDILARSVAAMGTEFDLLLTAEQVKAYKPDEQVFREGLRRLRRAPQECLHASFSMYHDLEPARRLGFQTFWVDREGAGESEVEVDYRARSLKGLVELLRPMALP